MNLVDTPSRNALIITCPLCATTTSVKKSRITNYEKKKAIRFRCTCGCSFQKRIGKRDLAQIDIISAIARLDFPAIWYNIKRPLAVLNG